MHASERGTLRGATLNDQESLAMSYTMVVLAPPFTSSATVAKLQSQRAQFKRGEGCASSCAWRPLHPELRAVSPCRALTGVSVHAVCWLSVVAAGMKPKSRSRAQQGQQVARGLAIVPSALTWMHAQVLGGDRHHLKLAGKTLACSSRL